MLHVLLSLTSAEQTDLATLSSYYMCLYTLPSLLDLALSKTSNYHLNNKQ